MYFVASTLQRGKGVVKAICGQFSTGGGTVQEIVVARVGGALEVLRPDDATGKMTTIAITSTFSVIRTLAPFRLTGASRDYIVVGSDTGGVTVLELGENNVFKRVHCEMFGKTGCRRAVPGQYVACDPRGRALMVAAVEKQKLVYVMNRDASSNLTISSPLEAHKACTIVLDVCGVDVGFENPTFAVLELEYADADLDPSGEALEETEKMLTYYELDLGLNHVTRRWSEPVSRTANLLASVPGGEDGPSGVLVCGENWIAYKHEGHAEVRAPIPRRDSYPGERGLLVTAVATHKQPDLFFFLAQTEIGDLYKVTIEVTATNAASEDDAVVSIKNVRVSVFDSIFSCVSLCITKTGLLYAAAELGDSALFQFQGLGDDPEAVFANAVHDPELGDDSYSAAKVAPVFQPTDRPKNLLLVDEAESLSAATDFFVDEQRGHALYVLCGARGARSSFCVLRHGVGVTEMAVSELPGRPSAVWTVKQRIEDEYDKFIVVSFTNATLVLSIGETVEEVTDSNFLVTAPTLDVALLADNGLVQCHPTGIRHVRDGGRKNEWKAPGNKRIQAASCNERQVAVSLEAGELIYFELDERGLLEEVGTKDLGLDLSCLDVGPVPASRVRSPFLAIGAYDGSLRLLSLDPAELLVQLSTIQLGARAESVKFLHAPNAPSLLRIHAGLANGVLQRAAIDAQSGMVSDARSRFLGSRPVRLFRVALKNQHALLALSSKPWLAFDEPSRKSSAGLVLAPLGYEALEFGSSFRSEQCPEGIVAIAGSTLRIFVPEKLADTFHRTLMPLRYTPRKLVPLPGSNRLLVVEADQHQYNQAEQQALQAAAKQQQTAPSVDKADDDMDMDVDDDDADKVGKPPLPTETTPDPAEDDEVPRVTIMGPTPPAEGKWASCARVVEPAVDGSWSADGLAGRTLELLEFGESEAAFSCATCTFADRGGEVFVAIGTAKSLTFHPRAHKGCFVHIYRLLDARLVLLHKTPVDDVPLALAEFKGRLLVSVGASLRMYDLGKRKLLRKTEAKVAPNLIVRLEVLGDRVYVADALDSIFFCKYVREHNRLIVFADDPISRASSALCCLDYDTVALADKYGNLTVLRLPADATDDVDDPSGNRLLWDAHNLGGAPNKLVALANFHVGDTITQLRKATLAPGAAQALVYVTVAGAIGALVPSQTRQDKDFFQHLEMHMRQEFNFVTMRDHISFRGYFLPVTNVADGDLCDLFSSLSYDTQKTIASDLDRTPNDVDKKLEDTKNRLL